MLRSILVALDDTPGAMAARDAAIALARRTGAHLTAAVVLDRPHTMDAHEPVPIGAAAFKARRDAALTKQAEQEAATAAAACTAAAGDLPVEILRLEEAPEPALLAASATHDLIVLGRDCTLGREETENGLAPVVESLLQDGDRPLLVVPPGGAPAGDGPVMVAYDGSIPARRSLLTFALLGLEEAAEVRVVSVADTRREAVPAAEEGAAFLRRHGHRAEAVGLAGGSPAELLLSEAFSLRARLLVMGAFGHTGLRAFLIGAATRRLLREAPCPIFVQH